MIQNIVWKKPEKLNINELSIHFMKLEKDLQNRLKKGKKRNNQ